MYNAQCIFKGIFLYQTLASFQNSSSLKLESNRLILAPDSIVSTLYKDKQVVDIECSLTLFNDQRVMQNVHCKYVSMLSTERLVFIE